MIRLTFWEDPTYLTKKNDPEDYDEIMGVAIKTVKQIPELLAHMPKNTAAVSTEYSGDHKVRGKISKPENPRHFKFIWKRGDPLPVAKNKCCPFCGRDEVKPVFETAKK